MAFLELPGVFRPGLNGRVQGGKVRAAQVGGAAAAVVAVDVGSARLRDADQIKGPGGREAPPTIAQVYGNRADESLTSQVIVPPDDGAAQSDQYKGFLAASKTIGSRTARSVANPLTKTTLRTAERVVPGVLRLYTPLPVPARSGE